MDALSGLQIREPRFDSDARVGMAVQRRLPMLTRNLHETSERRKGATLLYMCRSLHAPAARGSIPSPIHARDSPSMCQRSMSALADL